MKAFVLTAGFGKRLHPITQQIPKPALPILNIPVVYYAIHPLLQIGVKDMIFNLHHLPDIMKKTLLGIKDINDLNMVQEHPSLLGSAGGIANVEPYLQTEDDFFVVNGDTLFLPETTGFLKQAYQQHKQQKALATLVLTPYRKTYSAVWFQKETGQVMGFGRQKKEGSNLARGHFTGYYLLSRQIFERCKYNSHIFHDTLSQAIKDRQKISCLFAKGSWFEMGSQADFLKTTQALLDLKVNHSYLQNIMSKYLNSKPTHFTENVQISKMSLIGNHVRIEKGCHIDGYSVLGDHVHLQSNVHLHNTVVLPHCLIPKGSSYENKIVYL